MKMLESLRAYGLFDAKVPRYTSYPPANRFVADLGRRFVPGWLKAIPRGTDLSIYVHIPFCRRLCWFCACRTQGTKSLSPVAAYIEVVAQEVAAVAAMLPEGVRMARLHLGGGTPTLLTSEQMEFLLSAIFQGIPASPDLEFSVEIDPTEASDDVMACLGGWHMNRASIGIQDFHPRVQEAIGRMQSIEETARVITRLRELDIDSLNVDLLYGLPHQTSATLRATVDEVIALSPDRVALYGYAHVPHMSKRQIMIPTDALPGPEKRYALAKLAEGRLTDAGYVPLGIDHYALPSDSLAQAAMTGRMRRNFQGYTDDPCDYLIGFGASAISTYPDGYAQNAVSTGAYMERVQQTGLAAHKGVALTEIDHLIAEMISGLMCYGRIAFAGLPGPASLARNLADGLATEFPEAVTRTETELRIREGYLPLARTLCARLDISDPEDLFTHSSAI